MSTTVPAIRQPTPAAELDRRRCRLRDAMAAAGVDALVIHNHVDSLGGYVKYVADVTPAGGYPVTVILPLDGPIAIVGHGPRDGDRQLDVAGEGELYGIERMLTTPSFSSASYTGTYDARATVRALQDLGSERIGLVGLAQMPHPFVTHLEEQLPRAQFLDAADLVDGVKAIKSRWERDAIATTVAMQVRVFEAALDAIKPGVSEWDVAQAALKVARAEGSEHGPLMVGAAPSGEPAIFKPSRLQTRTLRTGDRLTILVEPAGPDGIYAELGRTIVLGSADDALLSEHELVVKAWRNAAAHLVPGASAREVAATHDAFLDELGRPAERRVFCHGQGYDIVERPLVRDDEAMTLDEHMLIALHPMWVHGGTAVWVCDNVWIEADGANETLHGVEQKVFEL